jgi:hypothetical protein
MKSCQAIERTVRQAQQEIWRNQRLCKLMPHFLDTPQTLAYSLAATGLGAIAQLGERLHGMQEVGGSIPPSSTKFCDSLATASSPSSSG